jgi:hypothetical protein
MKINRRELQDAIDIVKLKEHDVLLLSAHEVQKALKKVRWLTKILEEHPAEVSGDPAQIQRIMKNTSSRIADLLGHRLYREETPGKDKGEKATKRSYSTRTVEDRSGPSHFVELFGPREIEQMENHFGGSLEVLRKNIDNIERFDRQCVGTIGIIQSGRLKKSVMADIKYFAVKDHDPPLIIRVMIEKSLKPAAGKTGLSASSNFSFQIILMDARNCYETLGNWQLLNEYFDYDASPLSIGRRAPQEHGSLWNAEHANRVAKKPQRSGNYDFLPTHIEKKILDKMSAAEFPAGSELDAQWRLSRLEGNDLFTQALREIDWNRELQKFYESGDADILLNAENREGVRMGFLTRMSTDVRQSPFAAKF